MVRYLPCSITYGCGVNFKVKTRLNCCRNFLAKRTLCINFLKRTCCAIVLLIRFFVSPCSRCRRCRDFLKVPNNVKELGQDQLKLSLVACSARTHRGSWSIMGFGVNASPAGWVGFLDMVWFGTVYSNVLFKFCDYLEKKTNKQEKTRKTLLCALMNDDLIQENIISYCFLRCYIYVSLLLTRLHMRLNGGMCLLQTSRDTDDVKRRLRPRVNPDLL